MRSKLVCIATLLFLASCATLPSATFKPVPDATHLNNLSAIQHWDININQHEFHLQMVTQAIEGGWQWIVLNDFGQRQVSISSQNGQLHIQQHQSSPITKHIDQLVMAWQLIFWPCDAIQASNHPQWTCKIEANQRLIYVENKLYARITFDAQDMSTIDMSNINVEYNSIEMKASLSSYPLM